MMGTTKSKVRLGVIAFAVTLALSSRADASFSLTTSVTGLSYSGGGLTTGTLAANTTYTENGISFTTTSQGGTSYTDSAGTTLYFVEDSRTAGTVGIPNEQIYVINSTLGAVDSGTFTFSTMIGVTNNGVTSSFNEGPSTLAMDLGGGNANYVITTSGLTPSSQIIDGTLFTSSNPQSTSGDVNSQANGAVSAVITGSAVPEPASLVMLGMGSLGIGGLMVRRARKTS
jgi:hypothetical protein